MGSISPADSSSRPFIMAAAVYWKDLCFPYMMAFYSILIFTRELFMLKLGLSFLILLYDKNGDEEKDWKSELVLLFRLK